MSMNVDKEQADSDRVSDIQSRIDRIRGSVVSAATMTSAQIKAIRQIVNDLDITVFVSGDFLHEALDVQSETVQTLGKMLEKRQAEERGHAISLLTQSETDIDRQLRRLEHWVLQGLMSPFEAICAAYHIGFNDAAISLARLGE